MTSWFADRVVVVTGAASGIGAAATNSLITAGAQVHTLDVAAVQAQVASSHRCDLGVRSSIDQVLTALPDTVDALFNCAGIPNGGRFTAAEVMAVNWLGLRHLTESLLDRIPAGGSVVHVASTAGRRWAERVELLRDLMAAGSFEAGTTWVNDHHDVIGDGYAFSKEAVQYYTLMRAVEIRPERDVRMNSVCPGVTNTAISDDFRRGVGDEAIDRAISIAGRPAEPAEMAPAILFLADQSAASYINGVNLNVDRGTGAAHALSDP